jgi:hypothetical protein
MIMKPLAMRVFDNKQFLQPEARFQGTKDDSDRLLGVVEDFFLLE